MSKAPHKAQSPTMCFFDQNVYVCGDWTWGPFRQHCNREYRTGEACGMKLIMTTHRVGEKCKICEKIDSKRRRSVAEFKRIQCWKQEGALFPHSIACAYANIKVLSVQISDLQVERAVQFGSGSLDCAVQLSALHGPDAGQWLLESAHDKGERSKVFTFPYAETAAKNTV